MSRVWLARTWAKSNGSSGGAGRWVSLPFPPASPSAPRGNLAPIPEAVGVRFIRSHLSGGENYYYAHANFFYQTRYFIHHTSSLQAYSYHKSYYTRVLSKVLPNSLSKVSPNSLRRSSRLARDISSMSDKFSILEGGSAGGASFFRSVWHPWLLVLFRIFLVGASFFNFLS
jgi:hypothetical protein